MKEQSATRKSDNTKEITKHSNIFECFDKLTKTQSQKQYDNLTYPKKASSILHCLY